jgi:hypothetical protein
MIGLAMIIIKQISIKEKTMKTLAIFILTMVLTIGVTFGSLNAEAAETSGSASVDVMSSYMWRGFEIHEDVAVQPSVGITYLPSSKRVLPSRDLPLTQQNIYVSVID